MKVGSMSSPLSHQWGRWFCLERCKWTDKRYTSGPVCVCVGGAELSTGIQMKPLFCRVTTESMFVIITAGLIIGKGRLKLFMA